MLWRKEKIEDMKVIQILNLKIIINRRIPVSPARHPFNFSSFFCFADLLAI